MAALKPNARSVVEAGRQALRPRAGDRERLEALLDARLAAPALPLTTSGVTPKPRLRMGWRFVAPVAAGVALVGGIAFVALRPQAAPPSAAPAPRALVATPEPQALTQEEAQATPAPSPDVDPAPGKAVLTPSSPAHTNDRLAQEVTLLSRATSDLRAGRAADALRVLDEHQRLFPHGVLSVERRAVRAQALCSLKRVSEGRAELARLAPQSPAAARAKQVCDAASPASTDP